MTSLSLKAENSFKLLKEAYEKYINPVKHNDVMLITDGGCENYADRVIDFTSSPNNVIRQLQSLVDIDFSNSMIEAYNKILKYRFLYLRDFPDFNSLERYLPEAIQEYNDIRPHSAHGVLTPKEALDVVRVSVDKFRNQIREARIKRVIEHRDSKCMVCR